MMPFCSTSRIVIRHLLKFIDGCIDEKKLESFFGVHYRELLFEEPKETVEFEKLVELEVFCSNHQFEEKREGFYGRSNFTFDVGDVFEKNVFSK